MLELDQQILKEFTEIVDIISKEVLSNTITPAFQKEVMQWSEDAKKRIKELDLLYENNVAALKNIIVTTAVPLQKAFVVFNQTKDELKEIILATESLETNLKLLLESNNIENKLHEISEVLEQVQRYTLTSTDLHNSSEIFDELNKLHLIQEGNQEELQKISSSLESVKDEFNNFTKADKTSIYETVKKATFERNDYLDKIYQKVVLFSESLQELERKYLRIYDDHKRRDLLALDEYQKLTTSLRNLHDERNEELKKTLEELKIKLKESDSLHQKEIVEIKRGIANRETDLNKKIDRLTIAIFVFGTATLTLLAWLMFL